MSILALVYSIVTTVASLAWDYKRRKKIRNLFAGQEQWRQCAIEAGDAAKEHWAARTVLELKIRALEKELNLSKDKQVKLTEAYKALSDNARPLQETLKARTDDLTRAEIALRDLQRDYLKLQRSSDQAENLEAVRAEKGLNS